RTAQANADPLAVLGDDAPTQAGALQRGGADVDPGAAGAQRRAERRVVPDPAGQFDRDVEPAHHAGDQYGVGPAAEGGVEVDQVDPFGPGRLPGQRRRKRVAVAGLGARRALYQPYRLTARHVHGGQQREAHVSVPSPFVSSAAPAAPDFSGWNWVAVSGPFSTAARNGPPWLAQVSSGGASRVSPVSGSASAA